MRIKLLVLTILFLIIKDKPAFAVTFSISNPQYSGEEITLDVSVSGLASNSCPHNYCYLQAAFTAPSPTRYFGFTKNHNGQWYEYSGSPDPTYIQSIFFAFLPSGGFWTGHLTLKINPNDTDYKGPGTYNMKAWRYTGNSSTAANTSNLVTINITEPTPLPSLSSTPTPSPTSSPTPKPTSSFIITNIPSQINSDQSFNVSINLSIPDNPNTNFYLKGAFKKSDSSNYFGFTRVSESWIKNGSSYSSQFPITTDSSGNWSGALEMKPDNNDSGFSGTGNYSFKVGRYTANGSGPNWSSELTTTIIATEYSQGETSTNTSLPTSTPASPLSSSNIKKTASIQSKNYDRLAYRTASVAAATTSAISPNTTATPAAKIEVKSQKTFNLFIWAGAIFVLIGIGSVGYIYLKANGKIPFKF